MVDLLVMVPTGTTLTRLPPRAIVSWCTTLGALPSIVMGASPLMDYMLTVAVSMSSASSFLVALYPQIQDWRTLIAVLLIVALTLFALRGVQLLGKIAYWPLHVFLALLGSPSLWVDSCRLGVLCRWLNRLHT